MTEQIVGLVSAEVDTVRQRLVPTENPGAKTSGASSGPVNVLWKKASGQGSIIGHQEKTLAERFDEAYDEQAVRDDEEFVRNLKRYHRRRFSGEW